MTKKQKEELNTFFVETFNKILVLEEQFISRDGLENLSVKELHILEAVELLLPQEKNTMSEVAAKIGITVGALTTAINALVRKNYIKRERSESDRRRVMLYLTEQGVAAEKAHRSFHAEMIDGLGELLSENSLENLIIALRQFSTFLVKNNK
jgi:DNA-binding MarR family transcriptional regulator